MYEWTPMKREDMHPRVRAAMDRLEASGELAQVQREADAMARAMFGSGSQDAESGLGELVGKPTKGAR